MPTNLYVCIKLIHHVTVMQWDGSASVRVIESGPGWWHVVVETSPIDSATLNARRAVYDVVQANKLGDYATSDEERRLVANHRVTTVAPAQYYVSPSDGYHSSNALIGMCGRYPDISISDGFQERLRRLTVLCCSGPRHWIRIG